MIPDFLQLWRILMWITMIFIMCFWLVLLYRFNLFYWIFVKTNLSNIFQFSNLLFHQVLSKKKLLMMMQNFQFMKTELLLGWVQSVALSCILHMLRLDTCKVVTKQLSDI